MSSCLTSCHLHRPSTSGSFQMLQFGLLLSVAVGRAPPVLPVHLLSVKLLLCPRALLV